MSYVVLEEWNVRVCGQKPFDGLALYTQSTENLNGRFAEYSLLSMRQTIMSPQIHFLSVDHCDCAGLSRLAKAGRSRAEGNCFTLLPCTFLSKDIVKAVYLLGHI